MLITDIFSMPASFCSPATRTATMYLHVTAQYVWNSLGIPESASASVRRAMCTMGHRLYRSKPFKRQSKVRTPRLVRVLVQALLRVDLTFAPSLNVNVSSDVCACVYLSRCRVSRRALRAASFVNVIVLTTQSACRSVTPPSYSGTSNLASCTLGMCPPRA